MSARRPVVLDCDSDGCVEIVETWEYSIREARAAAKNLGWKRRKGKDVCQQCEGQRIRDEIRYPRVRRSAVKS